ncbi:Uncharacterised protein [Mycobacteroides abscessus subsp. abscessus]|nr:Uncharacterised protein [Mycobacteroides abscessus subsp. abscessus]
MHEARTVVANGGEYTHAVFAEVGVVGKVAGIGAGCLTGHPRIFQRNSVARHC